ncbi:MAG: hypothetical protein E6Q61_05490 [Nitrosomonas sp.]|nr:MAG: hypothetical protein E6Q61_05490 [Nitrosomonas sp.]
MSLRPKPPQNSTNDDPRIDELINKGGSVATATNHASLPHTMTFTAQVQLRLKKDVLQRIDNHRQKRTLPPSRHAWILEAILEKLKTEV